MGFMANIKGNMALKAHNKGDLAKARELYEEAIAGGLLSARPMLGYAILLIRAGEYEKAMELLKKTQKAPDLTPERRSQLFVDYAACLAKTGELRKGVKLLARQHDRQPTGLTYETLGYLYVEYLLPENKPVADEYTEITAEEGEELPEGEMTVEQKQAFLDARWQAEIAQAKALLDASVDYDDESAVSLDNMGQFLYRVLGDVEGAKVWFEKAHAEKPEQVDSLWFLSRYDLAAGDTAAAIEKLETALQGRMSPLNFANREMIEAELARLRGI
ncbi:MAG: tetratricopeptide repeat protein [Clostridia bacterium]|nr:tetratricopeptide repeat protein [Clostridia bacterium]